MLRRYLVVLAGCLCATAPLAHATNLWQVWQLAKANDPAFKQAAATRDASMQAKPEAWAQLFPSIDLSAGRNWDNSTSSSIYPYSTPPASLTGTSNTRQDQWGAQLSQTLFNWQQFKAVQGADYSVAQAQATYEATEQNLMVNVAQAYFNVLNARDILNTDIANQNALAKQYEQTQQQYKVGLTAITGVRQAEAAFDQAKAQVIADRQALAQTEEALRAITGQYTPDLEAPRSNLPLNPPQPENVTTWVQRGLQQNPNLVAAQLAQKVAENQVSQQQAGYLPQLDLTLQHTKASISGSSSNTFNPEYPNSSHSSDNQIALQLSWNIFSGGATRATVKQYQYEADAAMAQEITQRRSVEQQVRNAYLAVLSGIAQVQATRQSVAASQVALEATEAGLRVGTQTVLDVLQARTTLLTSEKSYYNARYGYMIAVLQLEQAAGTLDPGDIEHLNAWLSPTATPGPASVPSALTAPMPTSAPQPESTGTPRS